MAPDSLHYSLAGAPCSGTFLNTWHQLSFLKNFFLLAAADNIAEKQGTEGSLRAFTEHLFKRLYGNTADYQRFFEIASSVCGFTAQKVAFSGFSCHYFTASGYLYAFL